CVKHAASVRPEPGSNSPNKNPHHTGRRIQSEQSEPNKKTPKKLASQKQTTPPTREAERHGKKQQQKQNHQTHY
ncbi:hypothetical protein, partial [Mycobacterium sp.]|uniref:hypothetical protein n=1 Tax=Mycobacterium sp. TaxID=1785 RepID=UPI003BB0A504